jgi:propane monooxygenase coupling protein
MTSDAVTRPVSQPRGRETVGISLISGSDTEAAVQYIRDSQPDARISDRSSFFKIERDVTLTFDMAEMSDIAGRVIDTDIFLVNMSSFYGRIDVGPDRVVIHSEIKPGRFKED